MAVLPVPCTGEVHLTYWTGHRLQVGGSKGPRERRTVEHHRHRKTQAQGLDAIAQIGQVDTVQLDPCTGYGFGDRLYLEGHLD